MMNIGIPNLLIDTHSLCREIAKDTRLQDDFVPGSYTVICGRGKETYNHVGNRRFRLMIDMQREKYFKSKTRAEKTAIVCDIVASFRRSYKAERNEAVGAFVRKDAKTGRWYDIGDMNAKEKASHCIRDTNNKPSLSESASKSQQAKKAAAKKAKAAATQQVPETNAFIEQRQQTLLDAMCGVLKRKSSLLLPTAGWEKRELGSFSINMLDECDNNNNAISDNSSNSSSLERAFSITSFGGDLSLSIFDEDSPIVKL